MFSPFFYFLYFLSLIIQEGDTKMYLVEVKKNTDLSGSRTVNSRKGAYGHDYADTDDNADDDEYDDADAKSCPIGSCEGCSEDQCYEACRFVYKGKKGNNTEIYQGTGKGKCVEATCKKNEDCKNLDHSGYNCIKGQCESECDYEACSACGETQCKELEWSCDWKGNKCVDKAECMKDTDCFTHDDYKHGDYEEGDLFCNKDAICSDDFVDEDYEEAKHCNENVICEQVACDPATMGGCEGCSMNQCRMAEKKDCMVVKSLLSGKDKCVSNTCKNSRDCSKFFTELCYDGDCVEGDIFCNKNATCERVVCDPATMGDCEGCSINQCRMADEKDCMLIYGKSGEQKCVSNTCKNTEDCRKLFEKARYVSEWVVDRLECKNGSCGLKDLKDRK